ncbi:MAG: toprim domain-containing protein [Desulfobulbus sp.]|nr:toprim domain-containing protein [Desulfobulbus sp.]
MRFSLTKEVAWERFIDRPERFDRQKARFIGAYGGMAWQPPGAVTIPEELWLVEGIFDAIALYHHVIRAAAIMSSSNYPHLMLTALKAQCAVAKKPLPTLIWALDADEAGRRATWKFHTRALEEGWPSTAAQPPGGRAGKLDWNDLHQRDRLSRDDLEAYRHAGKILLAGTPAEKAGLLWEKNRRTQFFFDHGKKLYWSKMDIEAAEKAHRVYVEAGLTPDEANAKAARDALSTVEICNCLPEPLYHLANSVTGEAWYYFRVSFPHDGAPIQDTFTPAQLAAASEFKKRLLSFPGAVWTGKAGQLDHVVERWTYNIKRVDTIDFLGYSLAHGAYLFNDVAVKDGKVIAKNDEDYFSFGRVAIRSLSKQKALTIAADTPAPEKGWFKKFHIAFGKKGVVALGYWLGCLFAEQIRQRYESWPFLEIVGEPGSGKTALLETLWKLFGRAGYEGFDPMKASAVGFLRSMAQFANIPVVLIEADREDVDGMRGRPRQQFYWDSLKSLYNGGSLRTTGVKSGGSDTYDPQFRAALIISQNNPVQASQAIMERIVHLGFDKSHHSEAGHAAALELGRVEVGQLAGFLLKAATKEREVLAILDKKAAAYEQRMTDAGIKNRRIAKNTAQVMCMVEALPLVAGVPKDVAEEAIALLAGMAKARERELSRDHPIIERFWETYEFLNGTGTGSDEDADLGLSARLNHSRDPELIAINLNHFAQLAGDLRQPIPDLGDIKKYLPTSKKHRFIEANRTVSSAINARFNLHSESGASLRPASVRCWIFKSR